MFNVKLNVQQGFHPRHFTFPQNAILPHTGYRRCHKEQGRYGGTGTVPSVFLPVLRISCPINGISQCQKNLENTGKKEMVDNKHNPMKVADF